MRGLLVRRCVGLIGAFVLSSCGSDGPLTTEPLRPTPARNSEWSQGTSLPGARPIDESQEAGFQPLRLPLIPANLDQCDAAVYWEGPAGNSQRRGQFTLHRSMAGPIPQPAGSVELTYLEMLRFDRSSKRLRVHAVCVVSKGMTDLVSAKETLAAFDPGALEQPFVAVRAESGGFGQGWDTAFIICYRYGEADPVIECEGQDCTEYASIRNADFNLFATTHTYSCPNGCTVVTGSITGYYCPGGGGGGSGGVTWDGSGGGGGEGGGEFLLHAEENDVAPGEGKPECSPEPTDARQKAWCRGHHPTVEQRAIMYGVLDRAAARGVVCDSLSTRARQMIADSSLRIFSGLPTDNFSGATGFTRDWVVIDSVAVYSFSGTAKDRNGLNLEAILMHEMDHVMNHHSSQTDLDGHWLVNGMPSLYRSLNSQFCSGGA